MLQSIRKAGLVCCSNGLPAEAEQELSALEYKLRAHGIESVRSPYLFAADGVRSGTAKQRADALTAMFRDAEIDAIFDLSGGDIANEILPYLDFSAIERNPKPFWGYSDLTVILNAIYAKTGGTGVFYQMRFLDNVSVSELFNIRYHMVQGDGMAGVVVGGNIRCLLKLAGTPYFPDLTGKLLLLEARSGRMPQMITFLSQLQQLGAFEKINGILLGTFTQMEREGEDAEQLVLAYANGLPVVRTPDIGHAPDAKAIRIGAWKEFHR